MGGGTTRTSSETVPSESAADAAEEPHEFAPAPEVEAEPELEMTPANDNSPVVELPTTGTE